MQYTATFKTEFCGVYLTVTVSATFDGDTFDFEIDDVICDDGAFEWKNAYYRQPDGAIIDFHAFIESAADEALFDQNEVTRMSKGSLYGAPARI